MACEAKYTLTESGVILHTQHPLFGDIPGRFQYLSNEKEKYGSPASFLIGAVLSCYCETLGASLHRHGAFFRSIEATGRFWIGKDEHGASRVEKMAVEVEADVEERYGDVLKLCLAEVRNCTVSRSVQYGFPVEISARRKA